MKLVDLEPQFVRHDPRVEEVSIVDSEGVSRVEIREVEYRLHVATLAEAHGIYFLCPKCFAANGGAVGTHAVLCWFEGRVPIGLGPGPGRWNPTGTGYADLSFVPGAKSHSVQLLSGCSWHGYVTGGEVTAV